MSAGSALHIASPTHTRPVVSSPSPHQALGACCPLVRLPEECSLSCGELMREKREKSSLEFAYESHSFELKSVSVSCDFIRTGLEVPVVIILPIDLLQGLLHASPQGHASAQGHASVGRSCCLQPHSESWTLVGGTPERGAAHVLQGTCRRRHPPSCPAWGQRPALGSQNHAGADCTAPAPRRGPQSPRVGSPLVGVSAHSRPRPTTRTRKAAL